MIPTSAMNAIERGLIELAANAPHPRKGIRTARLDVDPNAAPVFDIPLQNGPLVDAYVRVEESRITVAGQPMKKLVPILVFEVDVDTVETTRRFALIPEGGWISEPGSVLRATFVHPMNGVIVGVFECLWTPEVISTDEVPTDAVDANEVLP